MLSQLFPLLVPGNEGVCKPGSAGTGAAADTGICLAGAGDGTAPVADTAEANGLLGG